MTTKQHTELWTSSRASSFTAETWSKTDFSVTQMIPQSSSYRYLYASVIRAHAIRAIVPDSSVASSNQAPIYRRASYDMLLKKNRIGKEKAGTTCHLMKYKLRCTAAARCQAEIHATLSLVGEDNTNCPVYPGMPHIPLLVHILLV